jgi:hypothetical protein
MRNVLLVDTNFSSEPIYRFLIKSGYKVTVVGGNPNDSLAKSTNDYVNLDYSDVGQILRLVEERNIDYLVPGCNDLSYLVCAKMNAEGRFPGLDTLASTEIINNKAKFREFSCRRGLPTPRVLAQNEIGERWPVIIKPVDAFSGRGITIIDKHRKSGLADAINLATKESRSGACVVEDYVSGQLYSHSAFIQEGLVLRDCIVEEHSTANPFVVDTSRVVYDFPQRMLECIRKNVEVIAFELSLQDGLIHTQFISDGNKYWLIEITRRCPGDLYSQLIEISTGLRYAENYARPFVSLPFDFNGPRTQNLFMRHTLTQANEFILGSLRFNFPLSLVKWVPLSVTGDKLRRSPYGRIAIMFAGESTTQGFEELFQATLKRKLYEIEP